jgi:hypothetical protein
LYYDEVKATLYKLKEWEKWFNCLLPVDCLPLSLGCHSAPYTIMKNFKEYVNKKRVAYNYPDSKTVELTKEELKSLFIESFDVDNLLTYKNN